ncbi:hypothetical protein Gotri_003326, partial [Gossypium trilobum]|nr:hypothetical protein [Gossypium trilobum]
NLTTSFVATGEVLRNHLREWILGFNQFLGVCSTFEAELWGILDSLSILQERRVNRILIQIDSLEAVQAIQGINSTNQNSALIRRIQIPLQDKDHWMAPTDLEGVQNLTTAPLELIEILDSDKSSGAFDIVNIA